MKSKTENITLREATIHDLDVITYWDTQEHVIDSDPDDDWNWEIELNRKPAWREQLIAELKGRPIGFIQIIDPELEETHYWGEIASNLRAIDIWIGEKEDLNKGYGTVMMTQAINRCFAHADVTAIYIDPLESNHKAHRFYERLGFKFIENRTFDNSLCLIYKLDRKYWESTQK